MDQGDVAYGITGFVGTILGGIAMPDWAMNIPFAFLLLISLAYIKFSINREIKNTTRMNEQLLELVEKLTLHSKNEVKDEHTEGILGHTENGESNES